MKKPIISLTRFLSVLLLLAAGAQQAGAQFKLRIESGYSFNVASADFRFHAAQYDEATGDIISDTLHRERIRSKGGFGVLTGMTFPVASMGPASKLAIAAGFYYNALNWEPGPFGASVSSQGGSASYGSGSIDMALPVGLEYKYGTDAMADKAYKTCYSFGMGVYPSLMFTTFKGNNDIRLRTLPYLKAEVGLFAGICMKIRAMYTFGNLTYVNYDASTEFTDYTVSLKGKNALSLSLVLMPFSFLWDEGGW